MIKIWTITEWTVINLCREVVDLAEILAGMAEIRKTAVKQYLDVEWTEYLREGGLHSSIFPCYIYVTWYTNEI